jgi:hypothetical protein
MSKTMKDIILSAYAGDNRCDHPHPPFVNACRNCVANTIEREVRFWLAQDLRLVLDIALDGVTDKATIQSDYFQGWRDAIAHLDPSGQQFLDIISDVFIGNELSN